MVLVVVCACAVVVVVVAVLVVVARRRRQSGPLREVADLFRIKPLVFGQREEHGVRHVFDGAWIRRDLVASTPHELRVLTLNMWFSSHRQAERTTAFLHALEQLGWPDIVCLQEVTGAVWTVVLANAGVRHHYAVSTANIAQGYGAAMLVRRELGGAFSALGEDRLWVRCDPALTAVRSAAFAHGALCGALAPRHAVGDCHCPLGVAARCRRAHRPTARVVAQADGVGQHVAG